MAGLRLAFSITFLLGGLFSPVAPEAQQAAKVARIGYLPLNLAGGPDLHEAFRQGLRDLGYVEGRNLVIEYRDAEGKPERLPALAAELVALRLMSSWLQAAHSPRWPPSKRPGPSPLSSLLLPIRLRTGSSPALRGRTPMSPACPPSARS